MNSNVDYLIIIQKRQQLALEMQRKFRTERLRNNRKKDRDIDGSNELSEMIKDLNIFRNTTDENGKEEEDRHDQMQVEE